MPAYENRVLLSLPSLPRAFEKRNGERISYSTSLSREIIAVTARECVKGKRARTLPPILGNGSLRAKATTSHWDDDGFRTYESRWEWRIAEKVCEEIGPFQIELDDDRDLLVWFEPIGRAKATKAAARLDRARSTAMNVAKTIAAKTKGARFVVDTDAGIVRVKKHRISLDQVDALQSTHGSGDAIVLGEGRGPYTLLVAAPIGSERRSRSMSRTIELAFSIVTRAADEDHFDDEAFAPTVKRGPSIAVVTLPPVGDGLWSLLAAFEKANARIVALSDDRVVIRLAGRRKPNLSREPATLRKAIQDAVTSSSTVALVFKPW